MMNKSVAMTTAELVEVLKDILARVEGHDSFEGSLEYLMPMPEQDHELAIMTVDEGFCCITCGMGNKTRENLQKDHGGDSKTTESGERTDFMVRTSYRVGNSMGQGGMRVIGEM